MSLIYFICVLFVLFVAAEGTGRIFPSNPTGIEFHDFKVKVIGVKRPITSCTITHNFDKYENYVLLDRKHIQDDNVSYIDNWEEGECGVHFTPLTKERTGRWDFKVKDGDGVADIYSATVKIPGKQEQFQAKIKTVVKLGESATVSCSSSIYAKLYDSKGELVKDGLEATFKIERARYEDHGIWRCVILSESSVKQKSYDIYIEIIEPDAPENSAISEKTETDTHINLLWKFNYSGIQYLTFEPFRIDHCFFERPDGETMYPKEGVYFENYNYFGQGTDLKECGISIAKPLTTEDIGFWKMIVQSGYESYRREFSQKDCGFLYVGNTSNSEDINKLSIPTTTTTKNLRVLKDKDELTIQCSARSSVKYCYLKSPSGKLYDFTWSYGNDGYSRVRYTDLNFGKCKGTLPARSFDTKATGSWICGMGVEGLAQDLQITVDVIVSERKMITNSSNISGQIGSPVSVIFTSLKGIPLSSCRFNRPDGYGINVNALGNTTNMNYSEAGKGLGNGDCGLLIKSLKKEDIGTWIVTGWIQKEIIEEECKINISSNKDEIDL